ncbi:MAG: ParB/RepB/Spo0J family partition protein, partial [Oscillospiraceae bacterium]|nr:ParB/RepB/Spo0J family partition protein [Oscillospiraceae bacterium]
VEPNVNQPRKDFDNNALIELAESITEYGVLSPLLVRPLTNGMYQIIAGERRWRASKMAGLTEIPVIIREFDDKTTMQIALVENLQREGLNPIEEAQGYQELIEKYGFSQEQVSKSVGKSRSAVTNTLRLLNLPKNVCKMVGDGLISAGHARAILGIENSKEREEVANLVIEKGLSVREVEKLVKSKNEPPKPQPEKDEIKFGGNSIYKEIELALTQQLRRKVKVNVKNGKGVLQLSFYDRDDLKLLAEKLSK